MMDLSTHISQSIAAYEADIINLKSQLAELRGELNDTNKIVKHLATTNIELTKDMQLIYDALRQVAPPVDDPYDIFGFPFSDPEDDDMLN
jgi:archaellum component FlaC